MTHPFAPQKLAEPSARTTAARLAALALGTFAVGTDGFVIAGVLSRIADDLHVSVAAAGMLVTAFSIAYALAAPILSATLGRLDGRTVLVAALAALALTNALSALAPGYVPLLVARVLAAFAAAAYTPTAFAAAAQLAPERWRGRALSAVSGGLTVALVVGVPLGALVGRHAGWRATFWLVAAISAVALAGALATLRPLPTRPPGPLRARLALLRHRATLRILALTLTAMAASYAAYTYLDAIVGAATGGDRAVGLVLAVYGVGALVGNGLTGAASDRWGPRPVLRTALLVHAAALALVALLTWRAPGWALPALVPAAAAWGAGIWMVTAPQQQRLLRAERELGPLALSLNSSAIYAGMGLGSLLGGVVLDALDAAAVCAVAVALTALALVVLGARAARVSRSRRRWRRDRRAGAAR